MTDIYPQEQFIGKTFNEKLNEEMKDYFSERKFSVLGFLPRPGVIAMVHTLDESGGIKELGGSLPGDIINDNFGKWLAAMHSTETGAANSPLAEIGPGQPPVNISGVLQPGRYFYNDGNNNHTGFTSGESRIQMGSGATAPLVSDFKIETPFVGGPEANLTLVNPSAYNPTAGRVTVGVNIGPTIQSGTINEVAIFQEWRFAGDMMMSHDAVAAIPFILGETIFVQYFYQL